VDAYYMAVFRLALDELERASAENSAWLYAMDVDPKLDFRCAAPRGFAASRSARREFSI
jgi:hypothetical protein